MLLAPVTVRLSAEEKDAILENMSLLDDCGFEIEDFGEGGVILRAIPMYITGSDPEDLLTEIAYNLSTGSKADLSEKIEWIFHSVACRSAIKAGDKNEINRLTALVRDIKNRKVPLYCPHGRPVLVTINRKDLERQFGR
jgi:DNA mismatch repair protein MutL